jgi:signal transduction histidine kinase
LDSLRSSAPFAVAGGVAAFLAILTIRRREATAAVLALVSLALVTVPIDRTQEAFVSTIVLASVPLLTSLWVGLRMRSAVRWVWPLIGATVASAWIVARVWLPQVFDPIEVVRVATTAGLAIVMVGFAVNWRSGALNVVRDYPLRAVDLATVSTLAAISVAAVVLFNVPLLLIVVLDLAAVLAYPTVRKGLGGILEDWLLTPVREEATITATEDERARLAGEIHDGPLQELAAVMTDLDEDPKLASVARVIRNVSAELRGVSAALHPPILDDLGLGPAIAWLVDQARARTGATTFDLSLRDELGVSRNSRPPGPVELAVFRVIQEALTNAVSHADADKITVSGVLTATAIDVEVRDDGVGLSDTSLREARRNGRLGFESMRQRARAIGADVVMMPAEGGGTVVQLRWRAK